MALSHKDSVYSLAKMLSNVESLTEMAMSAMLLGLRRDSSDYILEIAFWGVTAKRATHL